MIPTSIATLITGFILWLITGVIISFRNDVVVQPAWVRWAFLALAATATLLMLVGALWFVWSNVA